jgi:hypothetical protein
MIRCVRDLREARMRGSGLRRSGIRRRHARTRRHATYRTEHQRTSSAVDGRTTPHAGYAVSQRKRKRIEEPFGRGKTIGGLARPMLRGVEKLGFS